MCVCECVNRRFLSLFSYIRRIIYFRLCFFPIQFSNLVSRQIRNFFYSYVNTMMYIKYNKHAYFSIKKSNSKTPLDSVQSNTRESKTHKVIKNVDFLFLFSSSSVSYSES